MFRFAWPTVLSFVGLLACSSSDALPSSPNTPAYAGPASSSTTSGGESGDVGDCHISYDAGTSFATGLEPWALALADFDGDRHLDIAVAALGHPEEPSHSIYVNFNLGDGSFEPGTPFPAGTRPSGIAVADLDGDGRSDLVVTSLDDKVSVLHNAGDRSFEPIAVYPVGRAPYSPLVVDLDGKNGPDLVIADSQDSTVSVLVNHGDGSFAERVVTATGATPIALAAGEFNGDGYPDVAAVESRAGTVSVLPGVGDGTFGPRQSQSVGVSPKAVVAADFDEDGLSDLAVARAPGYLVPGVIAMLHGDGKGCFSEPMDTTLGTHGLPYGLAAADLDGDGTLDLAVAGGSALQAAATVLNDGEGHFSVSTVYENAAGAVDVAVGDVNGDGVPDLVIADHGVATVNVILGRCR
ncbi:MULTISPECIES: VCBS repeat-containing protein [Sorangium]|uniref:Uncharacterized protein n=1 Tax=Sorangium cellulosum TaxID=56 RepID=A0A4P2R478_SORCE|nr:MULTISPECIES: VCBS repeat-containing protein [Sorangium]AUX37867.1 hypothetical protein SOCE836_101030 [Sorangium cellulosum]WCQ97156.1 hypothetical protein NQZ70_09947 [Sorangium sp. Soce836]